eukprot:TRINITY_DN3580_c0_g1_i1.p1 TRINITY_DN3580_c0_g1~~TRINITY_DN3580_c0_g1_i1.p1  ORF type:complete len:179 (-),score=41.79 TRINITY_DN3580_c0_g1_i1:42-578(-)
MPSKYSKTPENLTKSVFAKGSNLRVHFKNTRETAMAIKGMSLRKAQSYLNDVVEHKQAVPFRRFNGGPGRKAHAHMHKNVTQVRYPKKSCEFMLNLLKNAESNAEFKDLDLDKLRIVHVQVNRAPGMRRRTYRAHGRINPYMSNPCHVELILTEKEEAVKKPEAPAGAKEEDVKKLTQ